MVVSFAIAACSSTSDTATVRTQGLDPQTLAALEDQLVEEQVPQTPEQMVAGHWMLKDDFLRDCVMELRLTELGAARYAAVPRNLDCVESMRHVRGWALVEGEVHLYDAAGTELGRLTPQSERFFKGNFELNTEQVVAAGFQKIT